MECSLFTNMGKYNVDWVPHWNYAGFCDSYTFKLPPLPSEFMCTYICMHANLHTYLNILYPLRDNSLIMGLVHQAWGGGKTVWTPLVGINNFELPRGRV